MTKFKEALSLTRETKGKIKVGFWGLIGGAIIAMIVGFNWGGWTTSGTTQKMIEEATLKSQVAICVAQTMGAPKDKMVELQKLQSYERSDYIAKGGWDKMPGQKEAGSGVSQGCAEGLQPLLSLSMR